MATISQRISRRINTIFKNTQDKTQVRGIVQEALEEQEMNLEQKMDTMKSSLEGKMDTQTNILNSIKVILENIKNKLR